MGDNIMSYEGDDSCMCVGIKCNGIRKNKFLVTFHYPWLLENYLTSKKKRKKNELAKSYGGRNSLTLRSVRTLDQVCEKRKKKKKYG